MFGLPPHDATYTSRVCCRRPDPFERGNTVQDRGERVAQFVREHGQELVLGTVHALCRGPGRSLLVEGMSTLGFDTPPLRDVAEDEHPPGDGTVRGQDGRGTVVDGPHTTVATHEGGVIGELDRGPV